MVGLFAASAAPVSGEPVKPSWALTPVKLGLGEGYDLNCLGSGMNGNLLFIAGHPTKSPVFLLVDAGTGRLIKRIPSAAAPPEMAEWTSTSGFLPDGQYFHLGVRRGMLKDEVKERPQGKVPVGICLRIINTETGSLAERLIPFDNPAGEGMSREFCSWSGMGCVECKWSDNRLLMTNSYFLAEIDPATLKTLRQSPPPDAPGFRTPGHYLIKTGRVWHLQGAEGNKYFVSEFGKEIRTITEAESVKLLESGKIPASANPSTSSAEFFARSNGVNKDALRREGELLFITSPGAAETEISLGAANANASTIIVQRCSGHFLVHLSVPADGDGKKETYRGVIAVSNAAG